jgi:TldD protein
MEDKQSMDAAGYFSSVIGAPLSDVQDLVCELIRTKEDGELFLERTDQDYVSWKDGRVGGASQSVEQGFGLRGVSGDMVAYATGNKLSLAELKKAGKVFSLLPKSALVSSAVRHVALPPLYDPDAYVAMPLSERIEITRAIDAYARRKSNVTNVEVSLTRSRQMVLIIRPDGRLVTDVRPLIHFSVRVQREKDGHREWGSSGAGGRAPVAVYLDAIAWKKQVNHAYHEAGVKLEAGACPAGQMAVVLGAGWAGVILHEAIGHPLEGDATRKGESVFRDALGEQIASPLVTVVDDGTIALRRGSLRYDDEGTPTERTVLIDKGKLVSFMHDRQSARHYGVASTGNGRRESYRHVPIVRMRNTFMLSGGEDPQSIIADTEEGLYLPDMGGGQVDPVSGKFVFESSLAYVIRGGKVGLPVKGATLIGNATTVLLSVDRVGNDSALDSGVGVCGKEGQSVPVGVGQPTFRIMRGGVSVGGTDAG